MKAPNPYQDYTLKVSNTDPYWTEIQPYLQAAQIVQPGQLHVLPQEDPTVAIEESGLADFSLDQNSSHTYNKNRQVVRQALQAIVAFIFEEIDKTSTQHPIPNRPTLEPRQTGIDIGSGATGYMVEDLLQPHIDAFKYNWTQIDVNPHAVSENKKRHPQSNIFQGSYHRLTEQGLSGRLSMVTGLSSLDATQFIPEAIEEIRQSLKIGGFLLHIQDVRPGVGAGIREMRHLNIQPPYSVEGVFNRYTRDIDPISYHPCHNERFTTLEALRRQLDRAITQTPGMEIILNSWITAQRPISQQEFPGKKYYANMLLQMPELTEQASVIATIARRTE